MADALVAARRAQRRTEAHNDRAIAAALRPSGLTETQYEVLAELAATEGRRLRMQNLGDALGMSKSGMSRVVDGCVDRGWVTRELVETDRRGRLITLTEAGAGVLARAYPAYVGALRSVAS